MASTGSTKAALVIPIEVHYKGAQTRIRDFALSYKMPCKDYHPFFKASTRGTMFEFHLPRGFPACLDTADLLETVMIITEAQLQGRSLTWPECRSVHLWLQPSAP